MFKENIPLKYEPALEAAVSIDFVQLFNSNFRISI